MPHRLHDSDDPVFLPLSGWACVVNLFPNRILIGKELLRKASVYNYDWLIPEDVMLIK
jgi:hypothetical protein